MSSRQMSQGSGVCLWLPVQLILHHLSYCSSRAMHHLSRTANQVYFVENNHHLLQICTDLIDLIKSLVFGECNFTLLHQICIFVTTFRRRDVNRKKAAQLLREGKRSEARDCLTKCIDITPHMALQLMNVCTM